MFERFDLLSVFLQHFRSISFTRDGRHQTHWATIAILVIGTSSVVGFTVWTGCQVKNAGALLSASALASAVLLAVFAQLATLRSRLGDDHEQLAESVDEGVAHIMAAEILTLIASAVLAAGLMLSDDSTVRGPLAPVATGLLSYTVLVVLMLMPNLLWAYSRANGVSSRMDGFRR